MQTLHINQIESKLLEFSQTLRTTKDPIELSEKTQQLLKTIFQTPFASLWIFNSQKMQLVRLRKDNSTNLLEAKDQKGLLYDVFMSKKTKFFNNITTNKEYIPSIDNPDSLDLYSKIITPILNKDGEILGLVTAYSTFQNPKEFTQDDSKIFHIIMPYLVDAICAIEQCCSLNEEEKKQKHQQNLQNVLAQLQQLHSTPNEEFNHTKALLQDLQTPTKNLYEFLTLLEEKVVDPRLKHYIANAKANSEFISSLNHLIFTNLDTKKRNETLESQTINSVQYFSTIADSFVASMYNKSISFNVFIDPFIPKEIKIDTLKLQRVLLNLIDNAYKFTPKNRCIEFCVEYNQPQNQLDITIKDNGIAITQNKRQTILKTFQEENLTIESEVTKGNTFRVTVSLQKHPSTSAFQQLSNPNAKIFILMDQKNSCSANNIAKQLIHLGIQKKQIKAINSLELLKADATHLISFQNKLDLDTVVFCNENEIENLIVEEQLFSISRSHENCTHQIVSQYSYMTHILYSFLNKKQPATVLIIDDNQINITLLKKILSEELVLIQSALTAQDALELVEKSIEKNRYFSAIYIDELQSAISCDEILNTIRSLELKHNLPPATIASLSGVATNKNYDIILSKPFKREEIFQVLTKSLTK